MAAEAAVSSAVQILGNLLVEKVNFLRGVEGQVEWLKDELKRMQCFLKDAAQKQANNKSVRNWVSEIKELAQDAEDAIEIFVLKVENAAATRSRSGLLGRFASLPNHVYHLNKIGKEIESIKKRLQDIESSRLTYGIEDLGEGSVESSRRLENVQRRRWLSPWQKDKHLVGLNEDEELLLQKLILEEKRGLSIAAIVGMGGIGKSTLARKIYNHPAVAAKFECRAWVVVSSEFAAEDIIKQIMLQLRISQLDDRLKVVESMNDKLRRQDTLQEKLHEHLEGKRYFIVLDDVWEHTHWESLRSAFPDEQDKTSRLLFTSRNQIITKHHGYIHRMRFLNPDESWELLLKTAFIGKSDGKCPQELENIGREILKKCHGLPLAITVAGGLLVNQGESKSGWEKVLKQIKNYHLETSEIGTNVSAILELSYHNLPSQLKACFLCLGFFKEDAIIRAKRLVHVWVAQGFMSSEEVGGEETMEELAMSYLDELINRNLVQVKDMGTGDRVKDCHVHDLLRELSIRKAKEEIGFEILREEGNSSKSSHRPRHRAVQCSGESIRMYSSNQNKHLRSLFIHVYGCNNNFVDWKGFEVLRILDIEGIIFGRLPDAFGALIGLKYLRIRDTDFLKLPSWLDRLKNLEALDLANECVKLPNVTWKMDSLRHFYAGYICGPLKIDTWKNLETLKYIRPMYWMRDNPTHVPNRVRKLGIILKDSTEASAFRESLEKLENLVHLHLRWEFTFEAIDAISHLDRLTKLKLYGRMTRCPSAGMFPQNLSHLTLKKTNFVFDPMPVLGKLPKLLYLKLNDAYEGEAMTVLNDGFPMLEVLYLHWMFNLSFICIEGEGGMPELQRLEIYKCPRLKVEDLPQHLMTSVCDHL